MNAAVKKVAEELYRKYNHRQFIPPDPLQWVYRYEHKADREIVAFLAAALAYGRVEQINNSLEKLFARMGKSPADYVYNFGARQRVGFSKFKHRFNTGDDICDLLLLLRNVLRQDGSIEHFFLRGYTPTDSDIIPALNFFCDSLTKGPVSRGLGYLLANPALGSACKRLNLFLRWMVRSDEVDTGLWKKVDASKLIVPVDVHIGRLTKILGFHNRATLTLAAAREITAGFAAINPADPVKYDFALSRIGILEHCTGTYNQRCQACSLLAFCV
ncbi:MAG: TIGR02757 family protein [Sedimentisphaerales bacterium]|nr:TIGR02757 family protein [Sedimentisphaerales bacterium]